MEGCADKHARVGESVKVTSATIVDEEKLVNASTFYAIWICLYLNTYVF